MPFSFAFYIELPYPSDRSGISMGEIVDVIIIGGGFAGLSAAIEAKLQGKQGVVFEKMAKIGGNSIISDRGIAAATTDLQEKHHIQDSLSLMKEDILKAGKYVNNETLVNLLVDHAKEAFYWTKDFLGVKYLDRVDIFGGHSVARCYTPVNRSGRDLMNALEKKCLELEVDIRTKVYVKDFIISNGEIRGIKAGYNYQYPQNDCKDIVSIYANDGVILTTGGYGYNEALINKYANKYLALDSTNKPSSTNNLLEILLDYPIKMVDLEQVQLLPSTSIDEKGFGEGTLFGDYIVFPYGILIDSKTINRFTNELTDRGKLSNEMLKHAPYCYGLVDQNGIDKAGWDITKSIKKGVVKKCDSLKELSNVLSCSIELVETTLKRYNDFVIHELDEDFHKPITNQEPLNHPPYYVMRMFPKIHHTMGGVAINELGQVLNNSNQTVKGLYAAGETAGGVHGASRLGSMAVTDCIVFGRIAGKNIGNL